jgi:hypothetical protein
MTFRTIVLGFLIVVGAWVTLAWLIEQAQGW